MLKRLEGKKTVGEELITEESYNEAGLLKPIGSQKWVQGWQEGRGVRATCNSDQGCSEEGVYTDRARWEEQQGGIHNACGGGAEAAGECSKGGEVLLQWLDS